MKVVTSLACDHCAGAGKLREPCEPCAGRGVIIAAQSWYACTCSNLRCIKCGGAGRKIEASQVPQ